MSTIIRRHAPRFQAFFLFLVTAGSLIAGDVILGKSAYAQVITGDLVGAVSDNTGAVIPGATITVVNVGTQAKRTVTSNEQGEYSFALLPLGDYTLDVSAAGFKSYSVTKIALSAGAHLRSDSVLQPGEATQTVEVTADVAGVQTDSSTVATTVSSKATADLPLNGRNFVNLVQVQPGANSGSPNSVAGGGRPDDRRQSSAVSANGQQELFNNYILDGLDNNDRFQGLIAVRPSIDAIREIHINTNLYTAEVGRTAGAVVDILTKTGANAIHGTAYEFFRNDITDAKNFFAVPVRKPRLRQNQFGGSMGGPIRKDKTFFFGDYEGFRQADATGTVFTNTVPTVFEHNNPGNFSDLRDPSTGLPGPVVTSPDPTGLAYFKLYPLPNQPGTTDPPTNITSGNFIYDPARTQRQDTFDVRIDHNSSASDQFFARYSYANTNTFSPPQLPAVGGVQAGGTIGGNFPGNALQKAQNGQLNFVHIFSPTLIMELRAGYTRLNIQSLPINFGNNLNDGAYSIPGSNRGLNDSGLAPITVPGYAGLGDAVFTPILITENTFQYAGNLTYSRGKHTLKAGAALIRRQAADFQSPYPKGYFLFQLGGNQVQNIASLVRGNPFIYLRQNLLAQPQYRIWEPSAFVQDDWRVSPKLTLNLGIRYDIFTPETEKHGNLANLNLSTQNLIVGGTGGIQTQYSDLAPRFGFSFTPRTSTVVRGGFGLSFFPGDVQNALILINPPYSYASGTQVVTTGLISGGIPLPAPSSATALSGAISQKQLDFKSSYMEQFNLFVQQSVGKNILTMGYVGELGRHLLQSIPNIDLPAPSGSFVKLPAPYAATLPNVNTIQSYRSGGVSSYHSFQSSIQRQVSNGLILNANYTLAHGMDDVRNGGAGSTEAYGLLPNNIGTYDYSNSSIDLRNRFAVTASYELPFGKQIHGFGKALVGGWQVNSLAFWQTGIPFSITNASARINLPTISTDRPNVVGNPSLGDKTLQQFFSISSFVAQPIGTAGNARRNLLYGPHARRVDLSLFKNIDLVDNLKLQLRVESFNISNTPNFLNPNAQITAVNSAGQATGAGLFGQLTQTNPSINPRQFQFAAKFLF